MTFDDWFEKFKPIENPQIKDEGNEYLFEDCYEEDKEFIHDRIGSKSIWTRIFGENASVFLIEGRHLVNREGYYVTEVPYEEGEQYQIIIDEGYEEITKEDVDAVDWVLTKELQFEDYSDKQKELGKSIRKVLKYLEYNV